MTEESIRIDFLMRFLQKDGETIKPCFCLQILTVRPEASKPQPALAKPDSEVAASLIKL